MVALAGVLGADQTAGPQWLLSQPLIAGLLGGALCGDPVLGLLCGLVCQLAWNGSAPVGSRPNPDGSGGVLAAVLGARMAGVDGAELGKLAWVLAFALAWGGLGTVWIRWNRRWNARWTPSIPGSARPALDRTQWSAWATTAVLASAWVVLGGVLAGTLLPAIPSWAAAHDVGFLLSWVSVLVGFALAAGGHALGVRWRSDWPWLLGGLAAGALLHQWLGA